MANPYPMQGQMMQQPMGGGMGGQMGGGQMGGMNTPPPQQVKQGTSKAVPVVMSAGLAIGVFCGLLFGVGIPDDTASAGTTATATEAPAAKKADTDAAFQPERKDVKVPSLAPQTIKDGSAAPAGSGTPAGSAAPAGAGSGAGSAAPAGSGSPQVAGSGSGSGSAKTVDKPVGKVVGTLKVEIQPDAAAKIAKVSIDGKDIDGISYELDMSDLVKAKPDAKHDDIKKELKVTVRASGYIDRASKVEVVADRDTTLKIDLVKRVSSGTGGLQRPPPPGGNGTGNNGGNNKPPPPKCKKPPCGLIDI